MIEHQIVLVLAEHVENKAEESSCLIKNQYFYPEKS